MKPQLIRQLLLLVAFAVTPALRAATTYEWTFDAGNIATSVGNGAMTAADAATPGLTSFATTNGSSVPHINGVAAQYMSVPAFSTSTNGYLLTFDDSGPNGGGAYLNQYSILMDVYSPGAAGWQALFNTRTDNANDADWYIDSAGKLGIGALGYSAAGAVGQNQWYRLAFVADLGAGVVKYFVNGTLAYTRTGSSLLDGRFAVYSNADAGADLLLFNEGDSSGVYTHPLYVNSVAFTDTNLSDSAIAALGGASAGGIFPVPEPSRAGLLVLAAIGLVFARRRRA